ncbi:uncharacterized protein Tco025E_09910, partial [Trypanosoma conorhini]
HHARHGGRVERHPSASGPGRRLLRSAAASLRACVWVVGGTPCGDALPCRAPGEDQARRRGPQQKARTIAAKLPRGSRTAEMSRWLSAAATQGSDPLRLSTRRRGARGGTSQPSTLAGVAAGHVLLAIPSHRRLLASPRASCRRLRPTLEPFPGALRAQGGARAPQKKPRWDGEPAEDTPLQRGCCGRGLLAEKGVLPARGRGVGAKAKNKSRG